MGIPRTGVNFAGRLAGTAVGLTAIALALGAAALAQTGERLQACADCPAGSPPAAVTPLPPIDAAEVPQALVQLRLDDGTCESGLGAGVAVTAFQEFLLPDDELSFGVEILAVTARMNTGSAQFFAFAQPGAAPPVSGFDTVPIGISGRGPCPAYKMERVSLGAAAIFSGSSVWAGIISTGFAGRDSQTPGNAWLNCGTCGMTQYSPTTLTNIGLGGTWMIRILVETQDLVPVELLTYSIGR